MKRTVIFAVAAVALLLVACSSQVDRLQTEPSVTTTQVDQQQEQAATAYAAGESESVQADQPAQSEDATKAPEEEGRAATGYRPGEGDPATGAQDSAQTETEPADSSVQQEQPTEDAEPEQPAMVGRIIESGHRAGLPFTRNVVGDPDAPIVIIEYSDFL